MAGSVAARMLGDDYQAVVFWFKVCEMLRPDSMLARVQIEADDCKAFDDVVIRYKPGKLDEFHRPLASDHFQVKFHLAQDGELTWENLRSPKFINAETYSILHRLRDAQSRLAPGGVGVRFYFYTTWPIQAKDALGKMYKNDYGLIRKDKFHLGQRDDHWAAGERRQLREHLEIQTDSALWEVIEPLRFGIGPSLSCYRELLNTALHSVGLKPEAAHSASPYESLARAFIKDGNTSFDADQIRQICEQNGLVLSAAEQDERMPVVAVRSFTRWADYLDSFADRILDLRDSFDGRYILSSNLWNKRIQPQVTQFAQEAFLPGSSYELHLQTHLSIALALGRELPARSGVRLILCQATASSRELWRLDGKPAVEVSLHTEQLVEMGVRGEDLAVALSVTRNIQADVESSINTQGISAKHLLVLSPAGGLGQTAIRDGAHAVALADAFLTAIERHRRSGSGGYRRIHLFAACPVSLMFVFGRLAYNMRPLQAYEHDFDGLPGTYIPSIVF